MKLKTSLTLAALLVAVSLSGGYWLGKSFGTSQAKATADNAQAQNGRKVLYWYDPMSPGTRFDKPGKSPFMDMDLVPRYADDAQQEGGVQISARQQQNLGVRTAPASLRTLGVQIDAFGTVATDERNIDAVPALANGLIEKLFVSAPQQFVKKGQPLAQLWIPQWAAAQQEYLAVRKMGDASLTAAARARLQLLFMPEEVIRATERTGKPQTRVTLRAPHDGYISKLDVRTGAQVSATQTLFELASLNPVWLVIDYPENQASLLSVGSKVMATTNSWPGKMFHGTVSELLPAMETTTRTLKARVVLDNPEQQLKPGMYLNVRLAQPSQNQPVLTIPEEALITTGDNSRVLVTDGNGHFLPQTVTAGRSQNGLVEITSGLKEGQQVVTSGQFLIDSEASLRSVLPQMEGKSATPKKAAPAIPTYSTTGIINAVNADSVTISHQPVPALKWSAMTMDFAISPAQHQQIHTGDHVMFSFSLGDDGPRLVSVMPMNGTKEQP